MTPVAGMMAARTVTVEITPRMHTIAESVALAWTAPNKPEPTRKQMLETFYHLHAMQDLVYLLNKLGLRCD